MSKAAAVFLAAGEGGGVPAPSRRLHAVCRSLSLPPLGTEPGPHVQKSPSQESVVFHTRSLLLSGMAKCDFLKKKFFFFKFLAENKHPTLPPTPQLAPGSTSSLPELSTPRTV